MTEPEPPAAADEPPHAVMGSEQDNVDATNADAVEVDWADDDPTDADAMDVDLAEVHPVTWPRHAITELLPVVRTANADEPAADAEGGPPADGGSLDTRRDDGAGPQEPNAAGPRISGVDIREIDTADMAEVEKLFGLSDPTRTDPTPAAPVASAVHDAETVTAPAAAGAADEDAWDGPYRGRRRAGVTELRFWLAAAVVFAVIGGSLYGVLSLAPPPSAGSPAPTAPGPGSVPVALAPGPSPSTFPSATSTPTPSPATPRPKPRPTSRPTIPPPPPFEPHTIEAESGARGGSAVVVANAQASGTRIVQQMGNWGAAAGPGSLTIGIEVPTAGTYSMTISYLHPNGEPTRSAIITVNSVASPPRTFTVTGGNCCYTLTLPLTLQAGANTIVFSNPTSHAPALDKFLFARSGGGS